MTKISWRLMCSISCLMLACGADFEEASSIPSAELSEDPLPPALVEDLDSAGEGIGVLEQALGGPGSISPLLTVGGSGGGEFDMTSGGVIYGLALRTGQRVDQLSYAYYLPSNPDNVYRAGDPVGSMGPQGGNGGTHRGWQYCPAGYGAVGYYGRAGARLDNFGLICANLRNLNQTWAMPAFGGSGGSAFSDRCDFSGLLVGLTGRAGANIDQLTGICARF